MMGPGWYLRRLSRMGPREIAARARAAARVRRWRGTLEHLPMPTVVDRAAFVTTLPAGALAAVPGTAVSRLLATADRLLAGHAEYFGIVRDDMQSPDWSFDPRTGRRAPVDAFAFDVAYRDENAVGDVKQLWEPSRHQHLTVLAAAYAFTGDDSYAERVADHLKSWWSANPPLRGVHWVSGIELGIRLLSWVWVRRLLAGWSGAAGLFEDNPEALHQIWHHQRWLAGLPSRGSSANNHVVAEAAGQLAAACAFPWFAESGRWRTEALGLLDAELGLNTFPSGLNRELASEYHGLVLELGLAGAAEAAAAGLQVPDTVWQTLLRMTDALAGVVDARGNPPRQGDSDDGHGLVLDGAGTHRWASLLATGAAVFGRCAWWPSPVEADVRTVLLVALTGPRRLTGARPADRPAHVADAGLTVLRAADPAGREIWVRCDGGPHGFLSIAAHAHADALAVEVRHDGVDVLADPGTYCYHGDPVWRDYFRSTAGHNTLELDGRDQSTSGGPFMWIRHARSRVLVAHAQAGGVSRWCADHDGYGTPRRPVRHRRTVELDAVRHELRIVDEVRSARRHAGRLSLHFGPLVEVELRGHRALLRWPRGDARTSAVLELPGELDWSLHRGETDPPLGWYSPGFGRRVSAAALVGRGIAGADREPMESILRFAPDPDDDQESV